MKHITALVILLALATTAWADEQQGFYLGAGIGQGNVKADDIDDIGQIVQEFDSSATAFKLFGGWRFNRYVGAEIAYLDFGNPDEDIGGVKVQAGINGVAPYITGTLPIGPLEVFGKVGYLFSSLDIEVAGQKVSPSSGSEDAPIFGIGAGMIVFKRLEARLEYEYVDFSKSIDSTDAVWLSVAWRF